MCLIQIVPRIYEDDVSVGFKANAKRMSEELDKNIKDGWTIKETRLIEHHNIVFAHYVLEK